MVYNSVGPKERIPDIFGKKQYHRVSHNSDSLTSQIIAKRLNETGQLNQIQKLHSLQSPLSDYGKPTFYSSDTGARDRGDSVTNNAAVSDDARSGIKEVAKVFLGDRRPSGSKVSRYSKFHNIKQLLNANKDDEISILCKFIHLVPNHFQLSIPNSIVIDDKRRKGTVVVFSQIYYIFRR